MILMTMYVTPVILECLDEAVEKKLIPNRAEGFRTAARDFLQFHGLWKTLDKDKVKKTTNERV